MGAIAAAIGITLLVTAAGLAYAAVLGETARRDLRPLERAAAAVLAFAALVGAFAVADWARDRRPTRTVVVYQEAPRVPR